MKFIPAILFAFAVTMVHAPAAEARTRVVCRCILKSNGQEVEAPGGPLIVVNESNPWSQERAQEVCQDFGNNRSDTYSSCYHAGGGE